MTLNDRRKIVMLVSDSKPFDRLLVPYNGIYDQISVDAYATALQADDVYYAMGAMGAAVFDQAREITSGSGSRRSSSRRSSRSR